MSTTSSEVSSLTCAVAGAASSQNAACRLMSSSRKSGSTYAATMSGLAAGSYTFTARFTLTNGTSAQASATFSVGSGTTATTAQSACLAYDGTFTTNTNGWDCDALAGAYSGLSQGVHRGLGLHLLHAQGRELADLLLLQRGDGLARGLSTARRAGRPGLRGTG